MSDAIRVDLVLKCTKPPSPCVPYYEDAVGLLVKKAAGFKGLADMNGKVIGVAQSATSKDAVQKSAEELGITVSFSEYATYPEIKAALEIFLIRQHGDG